MRLVIDNLGKQYKSDFWGLRNVTLESGSCVLGLLGPNGAGKSTLMRILATITEASEGHVFWNDIDISKHPNQLRRVLGYLPQDFGVYPQLTANEFLQYMAAIKGLDSRQARRRIDELIQLVNLGDARNRPLKGFSGGMKQRVGIAQALLNDPALLIVDEPTVGLDPEERVRFRNLLSDLSGERIVIFSTHIVSDIEAIATDIVIMNKGRVLVHTEPEKLLQCVEGRVWEYTVPSSALLELRERFTVSSTVRRSDGIHVRIITEAMPGPGAFQTTATLEDAYLFYTSGQYAQGKEAMSGSVAEHGRGIRA